LRSAFLYCEIWVKHGELFHNVMSQCTVTPNWGTPPWTIHFKPKPHSRPDRVDIAIIGGGFTGLAAAAWLRHIDPSKSVVVFEAEHVGAGSSGYTGGLALAETASGDLPGLGDVLDGFAKRLRALNVECDLSLPGVWEIGRDDGLPNSSICWDDSGLLRAVREVPGGSIDPGKMISGLAHAAEQSGALIFENARVESLAFENSTVLNVLGTRVYADRVLVATNAQSLELGDLSEKAQPKFTMAISSEPLTQAQLNETGLNSRKPFYTIDLPYLWGRLLQGNCVMFGSGLVHLEDWRELRALDINRGQPAELLHNLEQRAHNLHRSLHGVQFTHRWGGPILIADKWLPVFAYHPKSPRVIVLGAFSGHGVALSVYLGSWAAEALLDRKPLPQWDP
jgi:glycine/D-amino acid oxidase-like deaminating enzyme